MRTYRYLLTVAVAAFLVPSTASAAAPTVGPLSITGTAAVNNVLTCDGDYTSEPGETVALDWKRGSSVVGSDPDYLVPSTFGGEELTCVVTVTDSNGTATASTSVTIADTAPAITGTVNMAQVTTGFVRAPSCRLAAGRPGSAASYGGHLTSVTSWTVNGTAYSALPQPIPVGATGTCTITVSNALGSASATSAVGPLTTVPPRASAVPIITGAATAGSTLTCVGTVFDDLRGFEATVEWLAQDTVLATGPTFVVPATGGSVYACRVVARFSGLSVRSQEATITIARPPKVSFAFKQPVRTHAKALALGLQSKVEIVGSSCSVGSSLTIPAKLAKSIGLLPKKSRKATATVGSQPAQSAQGAFTTSTKFSGAAKKALAKAKKFTVTHEVVVTCQGVSTTTRRAITLTAAKPKR